MGSYNDGVTYESGKAIARNNGHCIEVSRVETDTIERCWPLANYGEGLLPPVQSPPAQIPSELLSQMVFWVDAQDASQFTLSGTDVVSIQDASPGGFDLVEFGSDSTKVSLVSNGASSYIDFTSTSNALRGTSPLGTSITGGTVFLVFGEVQNDGRPLLFGNSGQVDFRVGTTFARIDVSATNLVSTNVWTTPSDYTQENLLHKFVWAFDQVEDSISTTMDGIVDANVVTSFSTNTGAGVIGDFFSLGGQRLNDSTAFQSSTIKIAEVIVFPTKLTQSEITSISNYLEDRWSFVTQS